MMLRRNEQRWLPADQGQLELWTYTGAPPHAIYDIHNIQETLLCQRALDKAAR
jgi:hypothetical protein